MKKIELETLYTPYTLDSYGIFTMENAVDSILEDLDRNYDELEWDYDTKGYLGELAVNWVKLMNDNILDDVIKKVESDCKVISPREYNFTTDCIFADFKVNVKKLKEYVKENREDYDKNKIRSRDGFIWLGNTLQTMLSYYLMKESIKLYDKDDYYMEQMEQVFASEYIEYKVKKEC